MIFFMPYCIVVQRKGIKTRLVRTLLRMADGSITLVANCLTFLPFGLSLSTGLIVAQDVRVMANSSVIVFITYCIIVR